MTDVQAFFKQISAILSSVSDAVMSNSSCDGATYDMPSSSNLEQMADDDAAWNGLDKSKRKAVLFRQRDRLAKQVKTKLGDFSKVSSSSPFNKKDR